MSEKHTLEFTSFRLYSDSTFKKMNKDELISYIKMLHHNWSATDERLVNVMNVTKELDKALDLYIDWTTQCDFGYDQIPDEYEKYKDEIENMDYNQGLRYIVIEEAKDV